MPQSKYRKLQLLFLLPLSLTNSIFRCHPRPLTCVQLSPSPGFQRVQRSAGVLWRPFSLSESYTLLSLLCMFLLPLLSLRLKAGKGQQMSHEYESPQINAYFGVLSSALTLGARAGVFALAGLELDGEKRQHMSEELKELYPQCLPQSSLPSFSVLIGHPSSSSEVCLPSVMYQISLQPSLNSIRVTDCRK